MTTNQLLTTFSPVLDAALERLNKFNRPEAKDVARFFGPCFESISRAANLEPAVLTDWLATQTPESITRESIHAFVRSLTEAPANVLALARAAQARIEQEIAMDPPLSARDKVLLERQQPLAERTRQSIEDEIYEAEHCKTRDGLELPDLSYEQWRALDPYYEGLHQELAKRDCRAYGVPYKPPVKRDYSLDMVPAMRG